jgi:hypothetical protein
MRVEPLCSPIHFPDDETYCLRRTLVGLNRSTGSNVALPRADVAAQGVGLAEAQS